MLRSRWVATLACGALLAVSGAASAATWQATGTVSSFLFNNDEGGSGLMGPTVSPGETFTFTWSVEPVSADTSVPPLTATYGRPYAASLQVGSFTYDWNGAGPGNALAVGNNPLPVGGGDSLTFTAAGNNGSGSQNALATLSFLSTDPGPLSGVSFPTLTTSLFTMFEQKLFTFTINGGGGPLNVDGFNGMVTGVAPVPLPAAAWLLLSGLAGVGAFARRRRREGQDASTAAA